MNEEFKNKRTEYFASTSESPFADLIKILVKDPQMAKTAYDLDLEPETGFKVTMEQEILLFAALNFITQYPAIFNIVIHLAAESEFLTVPDHTHTDIQVCFDHITKYYPELMNLIRSTMLICLKPESLIHSIDEMGHSSYDVDPTMSGNKNWNDIFNISYTLIKGVPFCGDTSAILHQQNQSENPTTSWPVIRPKIYLPIPLEILPQIKGSPELFLQQYLLPMCNFVLGIREAVETVDNALARIDGNDSNALGQNLFSVNRFNALFNKSLKQVYPDYFANPNDKGELKN